MSSTICVQWIGQSYYFVLILRHSIENRSSDEILFSVWNILNGTMKGGMMKCNTDCWEGDVFDGVMRMSGLVERLPPIFHP